MNLGPMPWILCGLCGPSPESSGDLNGSTANDLLRPGFFFFKRFGHAVIVPPVQPPPTTTGPPFPSVSFQISSAVVLRWISGFAGLPNCCGMNAFGVDSRSSFAFSMAPFMPELRRGEDELGPPAPSAVSCARC